MKNIIIATIVIPYGLPRYTRDDAGFFARNVAFDATRNHPARRRFPHEAKRY
jgi:hypothetical protein